MINSVLCALLIIAGLFLLLKIRPSDVTGRLLKPFFEKQENRQLVQRITGKPKGKLARLVDDTREMLIASGMEKQAGTYKWLAIVLAALGLTVGVALDNAPTAVVLAVGLGSSPLILIRIRTGDYLRHMHEKLESAMSTVTNSYISSGDLIGAVESSLHLLPSPVDAIFRQFYMETQLIDSDVVKALEQMKDKIDNRYWRDWVDVLMQCQRDRQLRFVLPGIVGRLGEMRRVQMETDTAVQKQMSNYIITVLIVLGSIPLMGAMMPDWYSMLTTTPVGKITMAAILATVFVTSVWVAQLYRPVEGRTNK
jgi:tight adherence protein B